MRKLSSKTFSWCPNEKKKKNGTTDYFCYVTMAFLFCYYRWVVLLWLTVWLPLSDTALLLLHALYTFSEDALALCTFCSSPCQDSKLTCLPSPAWLLSKQHLNECLAEQRGSFDLPLAFVNITMVVGIKKNTCSFAPCLIPLHKHFSIKEPRREPREGKRMNSKPQTAKPRQNYPLLLNNTDSGFVKVRCFPLEGISAVLKTIL